MNKKPFHFPQIDSRLSFLLIASFLVFAGLFTRYTNLSNPLLDFHPTRQLFGAIKARAYYVQQDQTIPDWQKEIARRQLQTEAVIEPPLIESASAKLYAFYGENTAFPRAISASFWLIGALFLYKLSKNLTQSSFGSLVAVAFYLLLPYGVLASRAFQPDPLMILLLIVYWWAFEKWCHHEGWAWAVLAGLVGGLTIFVKFTSVFFIVFVSLGFLIANGKTFQALKKAQMWMIVALGVLPAGIYFYYGFFVDPFLAQQFSGRFFIEKWIDPYFYLRWLITADNVVPLLFTMLGVTGAFLLADRKKKILFASMIAAYVLFGLTFAHHISSHDYYSLPLIPIIALFLGQLASKIFASFSIEKNSLNGGVLLVIALSVFFATTLQVVNLKTNNYQTEKAMWEEIGQTVGHQPGLISLTTDYGYPLEYYGWQNTELWPSSTEYKKLDKVFLELADQKSFFLITDFKELANQPELLVYLRERFPVILEKNTFILFDLTKPIK